MGVSSPYGVGAKLSSDVKSIKLQSPCTYDDYSRLHQITSSLLYISFNSVSS